jgi:hypothetical protein
MRGGLNSEATLPHVSNTRLVVWTGTLQAPECRETGAEEAVFERVFFIIERPTQATRDGFAGVRIACSSMHSDGGYKLVRMGDNTAAVGKGLTVTADLEEWERPENQEWNQPHFRKHPFLGV